MKNLLEDNCTRKNDNNSITSPDFCNDPSKMKAHATHKSEFDVAFKNKTGVFNNAKLFIAASSIPFKAISNTFNAFVTLDLKLNGMLQDGSLFPEFKDTGTELVKSLQETKLNESILKGKTGKSEKLQKVYDALSCLTWLPTTFHRDLVELALQCR
ncbi:uncharacterized protein LOC107981969 [Nasonia vitripennis]|uniref:Uncharacterized protein n=1 Tax=Nasonia vitripennis TaxID=7425 RepID=A0A7M7Q1U8_NASVI|nr:uncharacterized protein LOC107981969 [Nasonia vitripennis]